MDGWNEDKVYYNVYLTFEQILELSRYVQRWTVDLRKTGKEEESQRMAEIAGMLYEASLNAQYIFED